MVIPPRARDEISRRNWEEIPEGERRIILSGYEFAGGGIDDRSRPAVIDPEHVVVAVQYPNGESRVLDGEEAVRALRERGFLEEGSYELTARGRRGWETPYQTAEEEVKEELAVAINMSASTVKAGEKVTFTPAVRGGDSPFRYNWHTDDRGYFSIAERVTLSWDRPGKKVVTVFVIDDWFREAMASVTVTVEEDEAAPAGEVDLGLLEELKIYPHAKPVSTSFALRQGRTYVIEYSGVITSRFYSDAGRHLATKTHDPFYNVEHRIHHDQDELGSRVDLTSEHNNRPYDTELRYAYGPYDDLAVNTFAKLFFEKYNPQHIYRVEYKGTGEPLTFWYYWYSSPTSYHQGTGSFSVKIYEHLE